ncbi:amino acid/polyamine transporter I [Suillus fuscotomentosus]|uniref:Amino acid/polyamine transporter I n=1 Tax=Suillus fuscotomentosus TaxID=1912939 RepID=A0AAD4HMI9_9AGAM|nr:amino acid/polyamine transporter I [Suillus fuscotomentosus]KAG1901917.1 amino acid/polyamine transporter I [Suillus fuscotomentosus]
MVAPRAPEISKSHPQPSADETALAELGYKQEFHREFTPLEVSGLAFSYAGVVPSIVSVLFYAIPNGGPFAMVWGWAVACPFIMCIGLTMAELASAAPTSGGLYYWTYSLASPRCRNFLSWIVGYANTIEMIAGVASVNWACAIQITAAITVTSSDQAYAATNQQLYGIYAAVLLSQAVLVSFGTKVLARLQRLFTLVNVLLCFIIIIALPIATPSDYRNTAKFALGDFTNLIGWPSGFAFILSLMAPLSAIGGYDAAVHMSEEASNAATAIPWAIISSIALSAVLGWGINISLAFCMGTDIISVLNSPLGQPMAQILFNSLGQKKALALWWLIIVAEYTMGSTYLLVGSRQTFAFARDGALPFSRYLYRINRYTETPVNTVWFDTICALAIGLLAFVSTEAINAAFTINVTSSYVAYILPITTRFALKNDFKPGPFYLGKLSFPVAAIAVVWMVFVILVFFFPATPQTTIQEMNYTVVVLGASMFLAIFWYYCPVYGGVHWYTGPIYNFTPAIGGEDGHRDEDLMSEKERSDADVSVRAVDSKS